MSACGGSGAVSGDPQDSLISISEIEHTITGGTSHKKQQKAVIKPQTFIRHLCEQTPNAGTSQTLSFLLCSSAAIIGELFHVCLCVLPCKDQKQYSVFVHSLVTLQRAM